jgi:peptidoglycan hydrolase CwlO-like protein
VLWGIAVLFVIVMLAQQGIIMVHLKELKMALETMQQAVEKAANVQQAAIVTLHFLRDRIVEISKHPSNVVNAELAALASELNQKTDALAAAISDHEEDDDAKVEGDDV